MRMSSPTYDDQIGDLDDDSLQELDVIEFSLSQRQPSSPSSTKRKSLGGDDDGQTKRARIESDATVERNPVYPPASQIPKGKEREESSPEPEDSEEQMPDYSGWFEFDATQTPALPGFQKLSSIVSSQSNAPPVAISVAPAFSSSSQASVLQPSQAALEQARKKMLEWSEQDKDLEKPDTSASRDSAGPSNDIGTGFRPALRPLENHPDPFAANDALKAPSTPVKVTAALPKPFGKTKGFKSPFVGVPPSSTVYPRTPTVNSPSKSGTQTTTALTQIGRMQNLPTTPGAMQPPSFQSPLRTGLSKRVPRTGFSTPFKTGMKPGEPGRQALPSTPGSAKGKEKQATPLRSQSVQLVAKQAKRTLQSLGFAPQRYTPDEFEGMGIDALQLQQITPQTALYYTFHTDSSSTPSSSFIPSTADSFGPSKALDELHRRGCTLATKPWVDNHWSMILWKLAGMVCLDPQSEATPGKRWTWDEVMRQLVYRYNRELHNASRPPFRLITTGDASAALPMVVCISNITWPEQDVKDGKLVPRCPEVEVTDGWYRLRAVIDEPLARAAVKGLLRVGRKLCVAGAKLVSAKKEPAEVLKAYNSVHLQLYGNSTHLAPWHAKLGFQRSPFIAGLRSLTADGGPVPVMDLVIEKAYAIAYLEFKTTEDGKNVREGPRNEADERAENYKWTERRAAEEAKLRESLSKRWSKWEGWAERLEMLAGSKFQPKEDDLPPDDIEDLFDDLEGNSAEANSALLKRLSVMQAGYLASFIRKKIDQDREAAGQEIEGELSDLCPPRDVRNFRVLVVRDARTGSKPCLRTAQLTVWDAASLALSDDGGAAAFAAGQRFLVTNLVPSQRSAWMALDPRVESQAFLNTRRDSRWRRVRE